MENVGLNGVEFWVTWCGVLGYMVESLGLNGAEFCLTCVEWCVTWWGVGLHGRGCWVTL